MKYEDEIKEGIREVIEEMEIDYFPTQQQISNFYGNLSLVCKIQKTGGQVYWSSVLGLKSKPRKDGVVKKYEKKHFEPKECVICKKIFQPKSNKNNTCSEICRKKRKRERDQLYAKSFHSVNKGEKAERKKESDLIPFQNALAREANLSYGQYQKLLFLEEQKKKSAQI